MYQPDFNNCFVLENCVKIFVPSTLDIDRKAEPEIVENIVDYIASQFSDWFGGATSYNTTGYYKANSGKLIKEYPVVVYSNCDDESLKAHYHDIIAICDDLREKMNQEAISLEINGILRMI